MTATYRIMPAPERTDVLDIRTPIGRAFMLPILGPSSMAVLDVVTFHPATDVPVTEIQAGTGLSPVQCGRTLERLRLFGVACPLDPSADPEPHARWELDVWAQEARLCHQIHRRSQQRPLSPFLQELAYQWLGLVPEESTPAHA